MTGIVASSLWIVASGVPLRFFLRFLAIERGDLRAMLDDLVDQQPTLSRDERRVGAGGRREVGHGIVAAGQRRAQPRDVDLLGAQIVA